MAALSMKRLFLATGLLFLASFVTKAASTEDFYECLPGMPKVGVSYPRGDTELLVGSDAIDIFCHLNPNYKPYWGKGLRSSHLSFHLRPKDGSEWAELESRIINETTIAAKYNPDRVAKDNIECRVDYNGNQRGLCNQMMYVGFSALPPVNFTCISDNWQSLNCTWDVPYNPIRTNYELIYYESGSGGRHFPCPADHETSIYNSHNCYLKTGSQSTYRKLNPIYQLYMFANNSIGFNYTHLPIEHYDIGKLKKAKGKNTKPLSVFFTPTCFLCTLKA